MSKKKYSPVKLAEALKQKFPDESPDENPRVSKWKILNHFGFYDHKKLSYDRARWKLVKVRRNWVTAAQYSDHENFPYYQLKHGNSMYTPAINPTEATLSISALAPAIIAASQGELFSITKIGTTALLIGIKPPHKLGSGEEKRHPRFG